MKFYMVRREWSQTDEDNIILRAESKEAIEKYYKAQAHGPRFITIYPATTEVYELTDQGITKI